MLSPKEIGKRILAARKNVGISQFKLSVPTGVSESTINRYEKGIATEVKPSVIEAISPHLWVSSDWLLGNKETFSSLPENFPLIVTLDSYKRDENKNRTRDRLVVLNGLGLIVTIIKNEREDILLSVDKDPDCKHSRFEPKIYPFYNREGKFKPAYVRADVAASNLNAQEYEELIVELQKTKVAIDAINEVIRRIEEL